jgi:hypothetical protein
MKYLVSFLMGLFCSFALFADDFDQGSLDYDADFPGDVAIIYRDNLTEGAELLST